MSVKPCSRSLAWIVTAKSSQAKQFRDSRLSYERKKGNKWDDWADYPALLDRCSCQLRCLQLILMLLNAANTLRNTQWHSFICLQSRRFTAWAWSLDTTCSPPNSVRWVQWWCWRSRWSMVKLLVAWWLVAGNDNVGGDNKSTTQAGWLERTFAQSRKHSKWQSRYLKKAFCCCKKVFPSPGANPAALSVAHLCLVLVDPAKVQSLQNPDEDGLQNWGRNPTIQTVKTEQAFASFFAQSPSPLR